MSTVIRFVFGIFFPFAVTVPLVAADPIFNEVAHDHALQRYRTILKTDKQNEQARQGLADIAITFTLQAEQELSRARTEASRQLLTRVEKELPDTLWRIGYRARQADHRTQLTMGLLHKYGVLAKKDEAKACEYILQAKGQGIAAADYHAALCLTKSDPQLSLTLIRNAAEAGHAGAQELLARACMEAQPRNVECVLQWANRAIEQGRASTASLPGWLYAQGAGVERDAARALAYYTKAAQAGDPVAQNNLAELYETGAAGKPDIKQALAWYEKAAANGFGIAQLNLGRLYASGEGGAEVDPKRARMWLKKADAQGLADARKILDWLDKRYPE
jgi:TPR repeat protein